MLIDPPPPNNTMLPFMKGLSYLILKDDSSYPGIQLLLTTEDRYCQSQSSFIVIEYILKDRGQNQREMTTAYGSHRHFNCIDNADSLFIVGTKIGSKQIARFRFMLLDLHTERRSGIYFLIYLGVLKVFGFCALFCIVLT